MHFINNKKGLSAVVIVLVFAVLAGAGAFYFFKVKDLGKSSTSSLSGETAFVTQALQVAPQDTQFFVVFDSKSMGLDKGYYHLIFKALLNEEIFKTTFQKIQSEMGITFSHEELAELMPQSAALILAPVPGEQSISAGTKDLPKSLRLFAVSQFGVGDKAKSALSKFKDFIIKQKAKNPDLQEADYQGAKIYFMTRSEGEFAGAIYQDQYFLFAFGKQELQTLIDRLSKAGDSLKDSKVFQAARSQIRYSQDSIFFADLAKIVSPLLQKRFNSEKSAEDQLAFDLLSALEFFIMGSAEKDKYTLSDFFLKVDTKKRNQIWAQVFNLKSGIAMDSKKLFSKDTTMYMGLNLKYFWNVVYAILGELPEQKVKRDAIKMQTQAMGIDFDKDILENLTGELAYSYSGLEGFFQGIAQRMSQDPVAPAAMPMDPSKPKMAMVLGLNDTQKFQELLTKVAGPFLMGVVTETYKDITLYSMKQGGQTFGNATYAYLDKALALGFSFEENNPVKNMIDDWKSGNHLETTQSYAEFTKQLGAQKPVLIFYQELQNYYRMMATQMGQMKNEFVGSGFGFNFSEIFAYLAEHFKEHWMAVSLKDDGFLGNSVVLRAN